MNVTTLLNTCKRLNSAQILDLCIIADKMSFENPAGVQNTSFDHGGISNGFTVIEDQNPEEVFERAVRMELERARDKFPDSIHSVAALTEECGEVNKAAMSEPRGDVYTECVQTAVMAMRVALEGDASFDEYRHSQGLTPIVSK